MAFWENKWGSGKLIKAHFLDLYHLAKNVKISVAGLVPRANRNMEILFHGDLNCSLDALPELEVLINEINLSNDRDKVSWDLYPNHMFSGKSCYNFIYNGVIRSKFYKPIWKQELPLKFKVFVWLVMHNKILTRTNLVKHCNDPHRYTQISLTKKN